MPYDPANGRGPLVLSARDLSYCHRKDQPVFVGLDIDLRAGSSIGLTGKNGAGKTTLLGVLTRTLSGTNDAQVQYLTERGVLDVGYATQHVALYELLTVVENLRCAASMLVRSREVTQVVDAALEEFGLEGLSDRRVATLSGGQQRIVHLATAFVHRPTIRILDEPTAGLDFSSRQLLIDLVAGWKSAGCALLVTAHYPEDLEEMCDDVVVLTDGHLRPLGEILDRGHAQSRAVELGTLADRSSPVVRRTVQFDGTMLGLVENLKKSAGDSENVAYVDYRATSVRTAMKASVGESRDERDSGL